MRWTPTGFTRLTNSVHQGVSGGVLTATMVGSVLYLGGRFLHADGAYQTAVCNYVIGWNGVRKKNSFSKHILMRYFVFVLFRRFLEWALD